MFAQLVTNNDEFQILVSVTVAKLIFQNDEGFNQPVNILMRADFSGIENKWIFELIAL